MPAPRKKKVSLQDGDMFLLPSCDGRFYLGHIVKDVRSTIGACFCYLYSTRFSSHEEARDAQPQRTAVVLAALITPDLVERGIWPIVGNMKVPDHPSEKIMIGQQRNAFVGARIIGSGNVGEYLDTYFGLIDESVWPDPGYVYSIFLYPPERKNATDRVHQSGQ